MHENFLLFQQKITCVIFLAAIDEYDTYLITEDNQVNNLKCKQDTHLYFPKHIPHLIVMYFFSEIEQTKRIH